MEAEPSRLRALLEELQAELSLHPPTDERSRELLGNLRTDLSRYDAAATDPALANTTDAAAPEPHTLRTRLQEWVVRLESSHPQLAAAIEQTTVALSNMGL